MYSKDWFCQKKCNETTNLLHEKYVSIKMKECEAFYFSKIVWSEAKNLYNQMDPELDFWKLS